MLKTYGIWPDQEAFNMWHAGAKKRHNLPSPTAKDWTVPVFHPDGRVAAPLCGDHYVGPSYTRRDIEDQGFYREALLADIFRQIDELTQEVIGRGFVWKGKPISLSPTSNVLKNGLKHLLDQLGDNTPFPIMWSTLDDRGEVSIENAEEINAFWGGAMQELRRHLTLSNEIKRDVRTLEYSELLMWEDPRD